MRFLQPIVAAAFGLAALGAGAAVAATQAPGQGGVTRHPECEVPFPTAALQQAPAGFKGETIALLMFNVKGEFRQATVLRTSGNEELDRAALRAAVGARCKPLGDVDDPDLKDATIGIPYAFTFDNSRGSGPAESVPLGR